MPASGKLLGCRKSRFLARLVDLTWTAGNDITGGRAGEISYSLNRHRVWAEFADLRPKQRLNRSGGEFGGGRRAGDSCVSGRDRGPLYELPRCRHYELASDAARNAHYNPSRRYSADSSSIVSRCRPQATHVLSGCAGADTLQAHGQKIRHRQAEPARPVCHWTPSCGCATAAASPR